MKRGRRPAVPYHPNLAAKFTAEFKAADEEICRLIEVRDAAFVGMLKSGLTTYRIAQLVGVAEGSVRYWAKTMGVKKRLVAGDPPNTMAEAIKQAGKRPGSVLFR